MRVHVSACALIFFVLQSVKNTAPKGGLNMVCWAYECGSQNQRKPTFGATE